MLCRIALTLVPQIGAVHARLLTERYKTAAAIFEAPLRELTSIEGIGPARAKALKQFNDFDQADRILEAAHLDHQQLIFLTDEEYPRRLRHCYDPPTLLFKKGNGLLNAAHMLAIIGSRRNTEYGRIVTEQIVKTLSKHNAVIVSGLAYGIDGWAHKYAIAQDLSTIAVVAHGLDSIYPPEHRGLAKKILDHGAVISEYPGGTDPDKHNFPVRNRIVAGMCEAIIVVETAVKGGSMITASLANGYNRDVFAIPGKWTDPNSKGCNELIRTQQAQLISSPEEIPELLGWNKKQVPPIQQRSIFPELSPPEKELLMLLETRESIHLDEWQYQTGMSSTVIAAILLGLEMKGLILSLPGKRYMLR